ncbi:MAG: squalene/phytoene synthase family protein [Paracoccaceae bacterium]
MTVAACAEIVRARDPDRFLATMAAPPAARERLWPLYALNLELARAAWVSPEPMICRMRLQWWADSLLAMTPGSAPPAHEVAAPVHALVAGGAVPAGLLARMAEARDWDTDRAPFSDERALLAYLDRTAGGLMWAAALSLGAPAGAERVVRGFAKGAGLAAWFCAVAELQDRGRAPLPDPGEDVVARLAVEGLAAIARARAARAALPPGARAALFPGWQAGGLLRQAAREPGRVLAGRLGLSEFRRRGGLLWMASTGRF